MNEESIPNPLRMDYWKEDATFRAIVFRSIRDQAAVGTATPLLSKMGALAGLEAAELAQVADHCSPVLETHNARGDRIDRIVYHPAYRRLEEIAYGGGCVSVKYDKSGPLFACRHRVGFALTYLFCQAEGGLTCPVCMTDGVARVLELYGSEEQRKRYLPRLASNDLETLFQGAMFLTEKQGGSDVGAADTRAEREGDHFLLTGEKWFCSNVDAEACLTLARPEGAAPGTKGLGLFLMLRDLEEGTRNRFRIDRIKDKLGVRSMPTGEVRLEGAVAELVGEIDRGFHMMTEMLNLSRLYNSVASISVLGRALKEARHHVSCREAFRKRVVDHPLAKRLLEIVEARHLAATLVTWKVIAALDQADSGDEDAGALVRLLTPVIKAATGKLSILGVSECLELCGGQGYIEESPMPRLLRDAQVFPIWEGTTNILSLDLARALRKTGRSDLLVGIFSKVSQDLLPKAARERLASDLEAAAARRFPEERLRELLFRLMSALELAALCDATEEESLRGAATRALELRGAGGLFPL